MNILACLILGTIAGYIAGFIGETALVIDYKATPFEWSSATSTSCSTRSEGGPPRHR